MKLLIWIMLFLLPVYAHANESEKRVLPRNVISVATSDWNGDARPDRGVLALSEKDASNADLFIFASSRGSEGKTTFFPSVAWNGGMAGQTPSLQVTKAGSLLIESKNESIGRERWNENLTVAYRDGEFVVAGYTFSWRDTLNVDNYGNCDINLLAGRGHSSKTKLQIKKRQIPLANWSMKTARELQKSCRG